MDPDDAADLIGELAPEMAERLLDRMKPEEAKDVRRLLIYEDFTAGGMMTPEPVILAAGRHGRGGAGQGPRRGAHPGAGLHGLRLPVAAGDADRALRRRRALPATAARATVHPGVGAGRHRAGAAAAGDANLHVVCRYFATYNLVNAPVVDTTAGCSVRSPSTTCSTTCCPPTGGAPSWILLSSARGAGRRGRALSRG